MCWLRALGWICVFAVASGPARAFVRATTPAPHDKPLFWQAVTVPFRIDSAGSDDFSPEAAFTAVRRAFQTWEAPTCSYLKFRDEGTAAGLRPGTAENVVVWFESGWPTSPMAPAITTITFVADSGKMLSADILLNGENFRFSASAAGVADRVDLQAVVTHEVGHFVGLAHSPVTGATMTPTVGLGETFHRDLSQDDIDGICSIYPPGSEPSEDSFSAGGCGVRGVPRGEGGASWVAILAALLWAIRRRRISRAGASLDGPRCRRSPT